jgi:hypothetical protein
MRVGLGLRFSAALVACACLTPAAFAVGVPKSDNSLDFSAESVALTSGANNVKIQGSNFQYTALTPIKNSAGGVVNVTFTAPVAGDVFTLAAGTLCSWTPAALTTPTGSGTSAIACPNPAALGPYTAVQLTDGPIGTVTLTGPDVAILGQNIYPGLSSGGFSTNPSAKVQITAQATGAQVPAVADASPLNNVALVSHTSFNTFPNSPNLQIDLTGSGLPASPPGGVFVTNAALTNTASQGRGVSRAGYLGNFAINLSRFDTDARTGLGCLGGTDTTFGTANPNCATAITGTATVTLMGDFATLTSAYLDPNNASGGLPVASQANCTSTTPPPANSGVGTGTFGPGNRSITFTVPLPTATIFTQPNPVFAICLVTNGTQVIQATNVTWGVSAALTAGAATLTTSLTPSPNQSLGAIAYEGTTALVQNVFGFAQTGTRTYFRVVNQGNTPAQVWAVLTKDVTNQAPETGAGSCTFPVAGGTAPVTATCNTSFVANLTSTFVTSNTAAGGSQGLLQPNTATYYTGDDIAALAGTTATSATNGFLESTVRLMSPNAGIVFSALSQGSTGILVNTP